MATWAAADLDIIANGGDSCLALAAATPRSEQLLAVLVAAGAKNKNASSTHVRGGPSPHPGEGAGLFFLRENGHFPATNPSCGERVSNPLRPVLTTLIDVGGELPVYSAAVPTLAQKTKSAQSAAGEEAEGEAAVAGSGPDGGAGGASGAGGGHAGAGRGLVDEGAVGEAFALSGHAGAGSYVIDGGFDDAFLERLVQVCVWRCMWCFMYASTFMQNMYASVCVCEKTVCVLAHMRTYTARASVVSDPGTVHVYVCRHIHTHYISV